MEALGLMERSLKILQRLKLIKNIIGNHNIAMSQYITLNDKELKELLRHSSLEKAQQQVKLSKELYGQNIYIFQSIGTKHE